MVQFLLSCNLDFRALQDARYVFPCFLPARTMTPDLAWLTHREYGCGEIQYGANGHSGLCYVCLALSFFISQTLSLPAQWDSLQKCWVWHCWERIMMYILLKYSWLVNIVRLCIMIVRSFRSLVCSLHHQIPTCQSLFFVVQWSTPGGEAQFSAHFDAHEDLYESPSGKYVLTLCYDVHL